MMSIKQRLIDELADEVLSFYRDALTGSDKFEVEDFDVGNKLDEELMEEVVEFVSDTCDDTTSFYIQLGRIEELQFVLLLLNNNKPWAKTKHEKTLQAWASNVSNISQ